MARHFNEKNRRDLGIVWVAVGVIFLFSGFSGGVVFLILGFAWLASVVGEGLELFRAKPVPMRNTLKNFTVVLLGLGIVLLSINAIG